MQTVPREYYHWSNVQRRAQARSQAGYGMELEWSVESGQRTASSATWTREISSGLRDPEGDSIGMSRMNRRPRMLSR